MLPEKTTDKTAAREVALKLLERAKAMMQVSLSPYKYRGCIAPEGYRPEPAPQPTPTPTPTPTPAPSTELKVGDKVKIVGPGNASSYGDRWRAGGIGWERQILKIWTGRKFPYQVGNSTGTTGFYKAEALKKI